MRFPSFRSSAVVVFGALTLAACGETPTAPAAPEFETRAAFGLLSDGRMALLDDDCRTLYAGQSIEAGTVCADLVDDNLEVTYSTSGGWELYEAHLWVGTDIAGMPVNNSNAPVIGHFPYNAGSIATTSHTFRVPLAALGFDPCSAGFLLAAHASVGKPDGEGGYQTETAWGFGAPFPNTSRWGWYMEMGSFTCDAPPPPPMTSETAFAQGGQDFRDIGFARWGWTLPLADGAYPLIAGQYTQVGTVTVSGDTVTFETFAGFFISETQLYAGATQTPTTEQCTGGRVKTCTTVATVAPGQYGLQTAHDPRVTSVTYTGVAGAYLIAHAVVWGNF